MTIESNIKASFIIGLFCFITLLVLIYSSLIIFIPRFHNKNNVFIINICISILITSIYYIIFYTSFYLTSRNIFTPNGCVMLFYIFNIASIEIPFSFVTFSVHRFCSIVHHNQPLFKTKKWIGICIVIQWIGVLIISLPFVFQKTNICNNVLWLRIYTLITSVIVPSIINIIFNVLIFRHVRFSTRRVQPEPTNQMMRLSRREFSLLRQMIFMFFTFIGGWSGIYVSVIINEFVAFNEWIRPALVIFSEICILGIIINLFITNHEIKNYLFDKIYQVFRH
ncbi:hypothetical protein I4U23_005071 [Adineta vaga]|nr:hypothetical protein I4U23_005071 [Adineta vaga]